MVIVFFTVTLSLAKINTDSWQQEFLAATLSIIVLINVFSATFQGGVFGLAGSFPSQYMNALLSGQVGARNRLSRILLLLLHNIIKGIGGVIVATINIILLAIGGDPVDAAFYCFLFSVIFLIGSLFAFVYLMRTPLYKQCIEDKKICEIEPSETSALLPDKSDTSELKTVSVTTVLEKIKVEAVTVFVIYIVTLGLFPAVLVLVESANINSSSSGLWETKYFVPVACFLFYNFGDYLGRIITGLGLAPKICSKFALVLSVVRIAFVPLMLLCNIAPGQRHLIPVLMESDTAYIVLMLLLAISNGYLTTIVMVNAPGRVEEHEQQTASNLMVGLLGLGLISGAMLSAGLINVL